MKNRRALVFALVSGLVGVGLLYVYESSVEKSLRGKYEMVTVLVATRDIPRYERLKEDMLGYQKIPKPFVQPLAVLAQDIEKLIIDNNVSDATIKKGEQITLTKLSLIGQAGISLNISANRRACTIAVNEVSGVAGLVRNTDKVDIIGTFQVIDGKTRLPTNVEATTIFQNVTVLAVGRNYAFDRVKESSEEARKLFTSSESTSFSNVTLELTARQCMDLAVAQQVGELSLALRPYHDVDRASERIDENLKQQRSTPESVTGIKSPVQITNKPRWLETRGNQTTFAP